MAMMSGELRLLVEIKVLMMSPLLLLLLLDLVDRPPHLHGGS
jgi:hypothetical protein